jgi:hypothetical protein
MPSIYLEIFEKRGCRKSLTWPLPKTYTIGVYANSVSSDCACYLFYTELRGCHTGYSAQMGIATGIVILIIQIPLNMHRILSMLNGPIYWEWGFRHFLGS